MSKDLFDAVKERRTIYGISDKVSIADDKIIEIVKHAVKYAPSAFNSQSARVVVLLAGEHHKLWEIVKDALRPLLTPDQFAGTEAKLDAFRAGHGTVMYFEDQNTVEGMQAQFPTYAENFPVWSLQSSGMLQYIVWTSLEAEGLGASLQHYNPLIDSKVKETWKLPESWKLLAEMPFGTPIAPPGEKGFAPIEDRVKIFG
jgi:hypothetical protein